MSVDLPETRYVESSGSLVAYQVVGDGPFDLVYLTGATSNVDARWDDPASALFLERLAAFSRLILLDRRGAGASDPMPLESQPTWDEWADDVRVVMDAVGSERAALFATLDAGPMGMVFAASHPDRTTALVLGNTGARFVVADDYAEGMTRSDATTIIELIAAQWGTEQFAVIASPSLGDDPVRLRWFCRYMRASGTPRATAAQLSSALDLDVRHVLPAIRVPTLVLHRTGYAFAPIGHGQFLADHIAGARFVELPGADSMFTGSDGDAICDLVEEFLTGTRPLHDADRVLATVLFTDIVGSTPQAAKSGDRRWRDLLDRHDRIAVEQVARHRGRVVKTTGDGLLATFDAPARGIRCAAAIREAVGGLGLQMRTGLHTGEIELRGDDIGGIAVHIAARISALAGAGEILTSRTLKDLTAGSGLVFEDRGLHSLKGVSDEWQVYAVA